MTRTTNARLAGVAFLVYIAVGIGSLALAGRGLGGLFSSITGLAALVLGVTLYALTREEDADLALLGLACRVVEAVPGGEGVGAVFFAVASTIFSWLMLRGRMIPVPLAWLGIVASASLVVLLLAQRAALFGGTLDWSSPVTWAVWFPMLIFEVSIAIWLIVKGVAGQPLTTNPR